MWPSGWLRTPWNCALSEYGRSTCSAPLRGARPSRRAMWTYSWSSKRFPGFSGTSVSAIGSSRSSVVTSTWSWRPGCIRVCGRRCFARLSMSSEHQSRAEEAELSWRLRVFAWLVRALWRPGRIAAVLAGRLGVRYARFLSLRGIAARALERGEHDEASRLARELLTLADEYRSDWNYGNAIHHGHLLLGRVALVRSDLSVAAAELL